MHQACPWNGDVTMKFSDLGWGIGQETDRERLNFWSCSLCLRMLARRENSCVRDWSQKSRPCHCDRRNARVGLRRCVRLGRLRAPE